MLMTSTYLVTVFKERIEMTTSSAEHDPMDIHTPIAEYDSEVRVLRVVEVRFFMMLSDCSWAHWRL
jgi:hypothetical protein